MFWSSQISRKLENMRNAEANLVALARRFGGRDPSSYEMRVFDTAIPSSSVPLKHPKEEEEEEELNIHGVHLSSKEHHPHSTATPLVLQHGYMNGGLYFFRNLVGLSHYFQNVYAIDMLGWGLSSRPEFNLKDDSVETAENFFVESLESWRKKNKIDKMILAGHSMGGYLSVAYSEKYPERVERLILLSPVGVPLQSDQMQAIRKNATFTRRLFLSFYTSMFENGATPCSVLRTLPQSKSRQYIESYVKNRLPAVTDPEEQDAISEYLYYNAVLPGSGEYCVNRILTSNVIIAKKPLVNRIPLLKIPHVSFLYGSSDWMDYSGGLDTQAACEAQHQSGFTAPNVEVYAVRDAGHLLMLDNWVEFNAGVVLSAGGGHVLSRNTPLPAKLSPRMGENLPAGIEISPSEAARLSRRVKVQS
jgi:cardiolipin-specific phospholipase